MLVHTAVDVLLLAAHPVELEPFAHALGAGLRAHVGTRRVAAASVGVGITAAGAGTMEALLREQPPIAVLVGSYGMYPDGPAFEPGRLLVPTSVVAADEAVLGGRAEVPGAMAVRLELDRVLGDALAGHVGEAERAPLATTFGITTDPDLAAWLGARACCAGENLEALAVGLACQRRGVLFGAVLGCTNQVGAMGRAQWLRHHPLAGQRTAERVLAWLEAGH